MNLLNPALKLVKQIREIRVSKMEDLKEMEAMISTGQWIVIASAASADGKTYLFSLGRVCGESAERMEEWKVLQQVITAVIASGDYSYKDATLAIGKVSNELNGRARNLMLDASIRDIMKKPMV